MRVIIAGSRAGARFSDIEDAIAQSQFDITTVISGAARGVDRIGEQWAGDNGIPTIRFYADWNKYGKAAGYRRNVDMANHADALIAVWNGESKGTQHMINIAKKKELPTFIHIMETHNENTE